MTELRPFPTAPTSLSDFDPYRFPAAYLADLPEEPPAAHGAPLPPPAPAARLSVPLEPTDRRRLDLHAALTTAGIAPLPGDLAAIEALCRLDDATHLALQRWITRAP
ncbi:hypothetical protein ACF09C_34670 [Streptomyces sp. NPDC014870]|uniref:hypothetical protein n=1 Tax=Streptomyces sp. NPDC014870 TaxID=3364925 RepID=UPI0036F7297A